MSKKSGDRSAINALARPEDFPIGSLESRAAARSMTADREVKEVVVMEITTMGMGISGPVKYVRDESGKLRIIGRELTLEDVEELMQRHPALRRQGFDQISQSHPFRV